MDEPTSPGRNAQSMVLAGIGLVGVGLVVVCLLGGVALGCLSVLGENLTKTFDDVGRQIDAP